MRTRTARHLVASLGFLGAVGAASAQTWEAAPSFPAGPDSRQHAIALSLDGTLLALGGPPWINGSEDGSVHSLGPGDGQWSEELGFDGYGAVVSQGGGIDDLGRIVIFGGDDPADPGQEKDPFVWDFLEGPWIDLAPRGATAPSLYFAYCSDPSARIYSLGGGPGADATPGEPNSTYCERYLGSADAWEVIAPLPIPVADAAAAYDGIGHLLVLGGYDEFGEARLDLVQQYDLASNSWSTAAVPPMPQALTGHAAVLGADGRVYVLGGTSGPVGADAVVNTTYVLNPLTNNWATGPSLTQVRRWFGAVLGDDDYIYALGGNTGSGGTTSVERLYTVPCPVFLDQPDSVDAWRGQTVELSTSVTGGGVIDFQWQRDGADLSDGPTGYGSTIVGATTPTLRLESPQAQDSGTYELVAVNSCGTTVSDPALVNVQTPPTLPTQWTFTSLHPAWADHSVAYDVQGGQQVGNAKIVVPPHGTVDRPVLWTGTAGSAVDLTPPTSVGGGLNAVEGGVQVGWWWWPYDCWDGTQWVTCYIKRGAMWQGTPASHQDVYGPGWEYAEVYDTNGAEHVGTITRDDDVGNVFSHGVLFVPPDYWPIDLHPGNAYRSSMTAIDGDRQYGAVQPGVGIGFQVGRWSGTSGSFVSIHPPSAPTSSIFGAGSGQQAGTINWHSNRRASLWAGTLASYLDLNPAGADTSEARDCFGGLQVGFANFPGATKPLVWAGAPETYVDLGAFLPAEYPSANAHGIDIEPDGTVVVVGTAYNSVQQRSEAVMWTAQLEPDCPGDLDGDGDTDQSDLGILLAAYQVDAGGDLDGDGDTDQSDLGILLADYHCGT